MKDNKDTKLKKKKNNLINFFYSLKNSKITHDEMMFFTRQWSTLFNSGISLRRCLDLLCDTPNIKLKMLLDRVDANITAGMTISKAFEPFRDEFSPLFVSLLKVAESTGRLGSIMETISVNYEKEGKTLKLIKNSLVYPMVIVFISLIAVVLFVKYIFPSFKPVFTEFTGKMPFVTKFLLGLSDFINNPILSGALVVFIICVFFLMKMYFNSQNGRLIMSRFQMKMPLWGKMMLKMDLMRFSRTLSILLTSGVPYVSALSIAKDVVKNDVVKGKIEEGIQMMKNQGATLVNAMAETNYFPEIFVSMIEVGFQTGKTNIVLNKLSDLYEVEVENSIATLVNLLEPMMIIIMGIIVGTILVNLFIPLYGSLTKMGF